MKTLEEIAEREFALLVEVEERSPDCVMFNPQTFAIACMKELREMIVAYLNEQSRECFLNTVRFTHLALAKEISTLGDSKLEGEK